jgi:hypothetical protein
LTKNTSLLAEATLISWDRNVTKMSISKQMMDPGEAQIWWSDDVRTDTSNLSRVKTVDPERL